MQQHRIEPGSHKILIEYWNKGSLGYVDLLWQLPGHERQLVPPNALFHAVNTEPAATSDKDLKNAGVSSPDMAP